MGSCKSLHRLRSSDEVKLGAEACERRGCFRPSFLPGRCAPCCPESPRGCAWRGRGGRGRGGRGRRCHRLSYGRGLLRKRRHPPNAPHEESHQEAAAFYHSAVFTLICVGSCIFPSLDSCLLGLCTRTITDDNSVRV